MEYDCKCKRARFIDTSTSIRETFAFADNEQILRAIQIYCCNFYGSMLWNLYGEQAAKFFRCWNTCTKLCWNLPRNTHVYFVDALLSCGFSSIRQQVLTRYVNFFRSLVSSPSKEVAVIAKIVGKNASTVTGNNLLNIHLETKLCTRTAPVYLFKNKLSEPTPVPPADAWRINLLQKYVMIRQDQLLHCEDTTYIDALIMNLCSN